MYKLGTFPGGEYSAASDINNHNQIVGGAASINDGGQIAATGCKAGSSYAVRLDPLP